MTWAWGVVIVASLVTVAALVLRWRLTVPRPKIEYVPEPSAIDRLAAIVEPNGEAAARVRAREEWLAHVSHSLQALDAAARLAGKIQTWT